MRVTGYPIPGKKKSRKLLKAFCGGIPDAWVFDRGMPRLMPGPAAFYGISYGIHPLYQRAKASGQDVYYIDNAYFDKARGMYYRVTRNALQWRGIGSSDGRRFAELGVEIKPWRNDGKHVLICPQSDEFMKTACNYQTNWTQDTVAKLSKITKRELRVRPWSPNKVQWFATLENDLRDCWAVVVYSSSSATSAMLQGIPAICTAHDCIARPLIGASLDRIENPPMPDNRLQWAQMAADHQWTLEEMRSGKCWSDLQRFAAEDRRAA